MSEGESAEQQNMRLAMALFDNDESVLGEILRLYAPDILESLHSRFTKRMGVLKYEDIEDAVSVALRKLWDARASYDDTKQSIRVWFYCLAEHVALDVLKSGWYKARKLEDNVGQELLEANPQQLAPADPAPKAGSSRKMEKEASDLRGVVYKLSEN